MIKITDDGRELCLSCGIDDDGALVERAGSCDICEKKQEQTLEGYLVDLGLKFKAQEIDTPDNAPEWVKSGRARSYRVSLFCNGRRASLNYYQGRGIDHEPRPADVIASLMLDSSLADYSLKQFGDEMGWSEYTLDTYKACRLNKAKIVRLFGEGDIYQTLSELAGSY